MKQLLGSFKGNPQSISWMVTSKLKMNRIVLNKFISMFAKQVNIAYETEHITIDKKLKDNKSKGKYLQIRMEGVFRVWYTNLNGVDFNHMGGKMIDI